MKEKRNFFLECIVILCLTGILLGIATDLLELKDSDIKYAEFFKQKEPYDVLFMGTSHVINGVFPMELWKDYGIVSYNFGGHGNQMATSYWVLRNALDYTSPKVVVIDGLNLSRDRKCSANFSQVHQSLDTFPLSWTKIRAIFDLHDDPNAVRDEGTEKPTKAALLWNYTVYHARWAELGKKDFLPEINKEKGAQSRIQVVRGSLNRISQDQKSDPNTTGEVYLRKMIEECQARGIEVLLTYLPFPARDWEQKEANRLYDIAEEYKINYINFLDMDLIDYQTDLYDANSHLNPSGARKVTAFLGSYLKARYDLPDRREDESYSFWNEDYDAYVKLKNNNLKSRNSIIQYLMLLAGDDFDYMIELRKPEILDNDWIVSLLENAGIPAQAINKNVHYLIHTADGRTWTLPGVVDEEDGTIMKITVMRYGELIDEVEFQYKEDLNMRDINSISAQR